MLEAAAALRWRRPRLTADLAQRVVEDAAAAGDGALWLRSAGWYLHGRAATEDAREAAVDILTSTGSFPGGVGIDDAGGARLRVELAAIAQSNGDVDVARALLGRRRTGVTGTEMAGGDVTRGEQDELELDRVAVLVRCSLAGPGRDLEDLRRAVESIGRRLRAEAAAFADLLVGSMDRSGHDQRAAAASALSGLANLGWTPQTPDVHPSSPHLAAALFSQWITALLDGGSDRDVAAAVRAVRDQREQADTGRQGVLLRLTLARAVPDTPERTASALRDVAEYAARAGTPSLEAACRATQAEVHEGVGEFRQALVALRAGMAAERVDRDRAGRFRAALAALVDSGAGTAAGTDRVGTVGTVGTGSGRGPSNRVRPADDGIATAARTPTARTFTARATGARATAARADDPGPDALGADALGCGLGPEVPGDVLGVDVPGDGAGAGAGAVRAGAPVPAPPPGVGPASVPKHRHGRASAAASPDPGPPREGGRTGGARHAEPGHRGRDARSAADGGAGGPVAALPARGTTVDAGQYRADTAEPVGGHLLEWAERSWYGRGQPDPDDDGGAPLADALIEELRAKAATRATAVSPASGGESDDEVTAPSDDGAGREGSGAGGAESGGAAPGGAESGGAAPGGVASRDGASGGAALGGVASGGPASWGGESGGVASGQGALGGEASGDGASGDRAVGAIVGEPARAERREPWAAPLRGRQILIEEGESRRPTNGAATSFVVPADGADDRWPEGRAADAGGDDDRGRDEGSREGVGLPEAGTAAETGTGTGRRVAPLSSLHDGGAPGREFGLPAVAVGDVGGHQVVLELVRGDRPLQHPAAVAVLHDAAERAARLMPPRGQIRTRTTDPGADLLGDGAGNGPGPGWIEIALPDADRVTALLWAQSLVGYVAARVGRAGLPGEAALRSQVHDATGPVGVGVVRDLTGPDRPDGEIEPSSGPSGRAVSGRHGGAAGWVVDGAVQPGSGGRRRRDAPRPGPGAEEPHPRAAGPAPENGSDPGAVVVEPAGAEPVEPDAPPARSEVSPEPDAEEPTHGVSPESVAGEPTHGVSPESAAGEPTHGVSPDSVAGELVRGVSPEAPEGLPGHGTPPEPGAGEERSARVARLAARRRSRRTQDAERSSGGPAGTGSGTGTGDEDDPVDGGGSGNGRGSNRGGSRSRNGRTEGGADVDRTSTVDPTDIPDDLGLAELLAGALAAYRDI